MWWETCRRRVFFFFQAEDGIRDLTVTGVQTCALPIWVQQPRQDRQQRRFPAPRWPHQQRDLTTADLQGHSVHGRGLGVPLTERARQRSEERRVGKECRSRWSPYH